MPRYAVEAATAGIVAAGLFLVVFALGLGFIFLFIPTLPLFVIGLRYDPQAALYAAIIAFITLVITGGAALAPLFIIFLGLPSWYLLYESFKYREIAGLRFWYPIGSVLTRFSWVSAAFIALLTLYFAGQDGGLPASFAMKVKSEIANLAGSENADLAPMVEAVASQFSFLIFSVSIWTWITSLYLHGWVVHRFLAKRAKTALPSFAIVPFPIPNWILSLLVLCALASLIGGVSLSFLGKTVFLIMLLPYFLLGAVMMHQAVAKWPSRGFFLFFVYFMIALLLWPVLILAFIGLWQHIKHVNKHLSSGGTSTKS